MDAPAPALAGLVLGVRDRFPQALNEDRHPREDRSGCWTPCGLSRRGRRADCWVAVRTPTPLGAACRESQPPGSLPGRIVGRGEARERRLTGQVPTGEILPEQLPDRFSRTRGEESQLRRPRRRRLPLQGRNVEDRHVFVVPRIEVALDQLPADDRTPVDIGRQLEEPVPPAIGAVIPRIGDPWPFPKALRISEFGRLPFFVWLPSRPAEAFHRYLLSAAR